MRFCHFFFFVCVTYLRMVDTGVCVCSDVEVSVAVNRPGMSHKLLLTTRRLHILLQHELTCVFRPKFTCPGDMYSAQQPFAVVQCGGNPAARIFFECRTIHSQIAIIVCAILRGPVEMCARSVICIFIFCRPVQKYACMVCSVGSWGRSQRTGSVQTGALASVRPA